MENFLDNIKEKLGPVKYSILYAFIYSILLTIIAFIMEKAVFHNDFLISDAIRFMLMFYILGLMAARSSIRNCNRK